MDLDPDLAWPFWKFGLKKDDLFTKLHDQYNTFPSSIQDPEAFHHDVFECSQQACTTEEFHRLLATRKEQRLHELNSSLESASLEIIANPSLIGTEQWQYALQLFRTKSLDSLVRYFSSYLPDNHPWHHSESGSLPGPNDDVKSKIHSSVASDEMTFFDDSADKVMLTHEPFPIMNTIQSHLPPSPRSMTMCSDASGDVAHHTYILNNLTPARTLSFSDSESEPFTLRSALEDSRHIHDDELSQPCDPETPISEYSEPFSETASFDILDKEDVAEITQQDYPAKTTTSQTSNEPEAETPTPKPEAHAGAFFDTRPSPAHRRGCSFSPSRPHPLAQVHNHLPSDDLAKAAVSSRLRRRDRSPGRRRRTSPGVSLSRIQKSIPDHVGSRHRGRRRLAEC